MNKDFWLSVWQRGKTAFHRNESSALLKKIFLTLQIKQGQRILVPLCGKSLDMIWLKQQGLLVTGVELSPIACHDFFAENKLPFSIKSEENFSHYASDGIEIFCGDFFNFTTPKSFQLIYDYAALVALPYDVRRRYAEHLTNLSQENTTILLFVIESDYKSITPPFSVDQQEIQELYQKHFTIELLEQHSIKQLPLFLKQKGHKKIAHCIYRLKRNCFKFCP